jgi:ribonuclease HI
MRPFLPRYIHRLARHDHQHRRKVYHPSTVPLRRCTTDMPKAGYYAVKIGKSPGIYTTWLHPHSSFSVPFLLTLVIREDCREQVDGYPCARYKKLRTLEEAEAWMQRTAPYPVKHEVKPTNHLQDGARTSNVSQPNRRAPASSSSSAVKLTAPGKSGSESQTPDLSSSRSPAAAGPSRTSASAEDVVYTDGACSGHGQLGSVAGIGVWWGVDDPRYVLFSTHAAVHLCLRDGW